MYLAKNMGVALAMLLGLCLLIPAPSSASFDFDNIMGMWLFDEGEGTVASDSSENGNDGTIHGATWVNGKFGKALQFDGAANWVEVPHSDTVGFEAGTSFTLTLHFKGTKVGGSLAGKNYEDKSQVLPWYMLWNGGGDNKVTFFLRNTASVSYRPQSATEIGDDEWHFVAGRADAETGKVTLWIDGKQEAELDFDTNSGYGNSEGVFHIGRHFDRYTAGIIDEVLLFNVALDEADMNAIMEDGIQTVAAVEASGKLTTTWGTLKQRVTR